MLASGVLQRQLPTADGGHKKEVGHAPNPASANTQPSKRRTRPCPQPCSCFPGRGLTPSSSFGPICLPPAVPPSSAFISMGALEAIKYADGKLQLLDQRLLPLETVYLDVDTPQAAWQQIKVTTHGAAVWPAEGSVASVMWHTCILAKVDAVCWGRNAAATTHTRDPDPELECVLLPVPPSCRTW